MKILILLIFLIGCSKEIIDPCDQYECIETEGTLFILEKYQGICDYRYTYKCFFIKSDQSVPLTGHLILLSNNNYKVNAIVEKRKNDNEKIKIWQQ